jgi:uncharacterized membrane protein
LPLCYTKDDKPVINLYQRFTLRTHPFFDFGDIVVQQSEQKPNYWLSGYIKQHLKEKSRFEIDLYLIQTGYQPEEIEVAWQLVKSNQSNSSSYSPDYSWGVQDKRETARLLGIVAGVAGIIVAIFTFLGAFQTGYDSTGQLSLSEKPPAMDWGSYGLIILSLLQIAGAWFATKQPELSAKIQLTATVAFLVIVGFTFGSFYGLVAPVALLYSLGGTIALSTTSEEPRWLRKTGLLLLLNLFVFFVVATVLGFFFQLAFLN